MKGLFIPDITAEMFKDASVESVAELMTEGKIYDIDYQEPCKDAISREDLKERKFIIAKSDYQKGWNDALDAVRKIETVVDDLQEGKITLNQAREKFNLPPIGSEEL